MVLLPILVLSSSTAAKTVVARSKKLSSTHSRLNMIVGKWDASCCEATARRRVVDAEVVVVTGQAYDMGHVADSEISEDALGEEYHYSEAYMNVTGIYCSTID